MSQEGDVIRIMERELSKRGYTTSNHDEGSNRVMIVEDHRKGTVTKVTIEPFNRRQQKN